MSEDKYYIKISPENILSDLVQVPYTASSFVITAITGNCCFITTIPKGVGFVTGTTGYYIPMQKLLSGGTNGASTLTGLTIPILLRQNNVDIGYYSVFDGAILQKDVVTNFVFSARTSQPYRYYVYNTSEKNLKNFLSLSSYKIDWGDGSFPVDVFNFAPNSVFKDYPSNVPKSYKITLIQKTPWGTNTITKTVVVPYTKISIPDPFGNATFTPNIGSWSATPVSYDYIFTGDSINLISSQTSDNYTSIPLIISGFTQSRIEELRQYGKIPFITNKCIQKEGDNCWGVITSDVSTPSSFTAYTIQGVNYMDFDDGFTVYMFNSSGLTSNWMVQSAMTKNEALLNVVSDPEVQSDIFIERGKNSALERVERIGEVDNIGDLENYGYGFFNLETQ
jgi:hypothetical protein